MQYQIVKLNKSNILSRDGQKTKPIKELDQEIKYLKKQGRGFVESKDFEMSVIHDGYTDTFSGHFDHDQISKKDVNVYCLGICSDTKDITYLNHTENVVFIGTEKSAFHFFDKLLQKEHLEYDDEYELSQEVYAGDIQFSGRRMSPMCFTTMFAVDYFGSGLVCPIQKDFNAKEIKEWQKKLEMIEEICHSMQEEIMEDMHFVSDKEQEEEMERD